MRHVFVLIIWCLLPTVPFAPAEEPNPSMKQVQLFPYDFVGRTLTFHDVKLIDLGRGTLTLKKPFPRNVPSLAVTRPSENFSNISGNPEIIVTPELGKAVLPFIDRHANLVVTVIPWHLLGGGDEWIWLWYVEKIEIQQRAGTVERTLSPLPQNTVWEIMTIELELWETQKQLSIQAEQREEAEYQAAQSKNSSSPQEPETSHQGKFSIPNVTPVESIKSRLMKLEEAQAPSEIDQRIGALSIPDGTSADSIKNTPSVSSPGKNRYLAMVEEAIDHQWEAPPLVASTPVVVLKFRIAQSGEISNIHIEESSGNGHYDSAAQRAVYAVNPLPPFPPDLAESFLEVRFRFVKD